MPIFVIWIIFFIYLFLPGLFIFNFFIRGRSNIILHLFGAFFTPRKSKSCKNPKVIYCKSGFFRGIDIFDIFGHFAESPKITIFRKFSEKCSIHWLCRGFTVIRVICAIDWMAPIVCVDSLCAGGVWTNIFVIWAPNNWIFVF